jgi:hypothetical protein
VDLSPKAEPQEKRGLTLYTLTSRLQKQKAKFNPYMAACNSLGYVTFFAFRFFKFHLSAMPSLPLATLSEHRLVCYFSGPPPCYIIPPFDDQTHLRSKNIILI